MDELGIVTYAAITAICYLVGIAVDVSRLNSKYIPVIMGACGAALGIACYFGIPDFASTLIDGIAIGIVSGFAATGINQIYQQLGKDNDNNTSE